MNNQNWEEEFDKSFSNGINSENCYVGNINDVKQFISELLRREREKAGKDGYRRGWEDYKKSWDSLNVDKQTELLLKHYKKLEHKNGFTAGYKQARAEILKWAEEKARFMDVNMYEVKEAITLEELQTLIHKDEK